MLTSSNATSRNTSKPNMPSILQIVISVYNVDRTEMKSWTFAKRYATKNDANEAGYELAQVSRIDGEIVKLEGENDGMKSFAVGKPKSKEDVSARVQVVSMEEENSPGAANA